ncbi:acyl-CoA dehydrogenase C-terminal domain-containing protein [Sandarakinorhabdus sp.]|uniref:acyl-CoA dehydrogenase C-terminal domain-containing protein n=1 Tax=Sandarakinorhabdus sp. TaxID=1916663 RepID=UPI003F6EB7A4
MPRYHAPVKDTLFVLDAVAGLHDHADVPGFAALTPDLVEAVLTEGGKFCGEVLAPLNLPGDRQGCTRHPDGSVTTPDGFRDAYAQFCEGGWGGLIADEHHGGQGLPYVMGAVLQEYIGAANMAFGMYPGLSEGAQAAIEVVGSPEQKAKWLPPMVHGRWTGTMNLTEPHCGTDLGLIRTRAEPLSNDSYAITGTKIFISAGEHDLAENIIHLVLAKTPGAPDNVKGISLFLVPKFLVNDDGSLGARNGVSCGSIEHKMGIHANATCVMNYDGATGYLLGEENKGLAAMFIMMNAARLGVGIQGLSQADAAYQNAVDYAKGRLQGRSLTGAKNPEGKADPIIVHPDVRRMLMDARAYTEGMRALVLWSAIRVDLARKSPDAAAREMADDLISLLTPVIKGYGTDRGYEVATNCQQVLGGHGYIAEWGMDQFVRDARIAMIYEGTNGIQALDLVGRKLGAKGGRGTQAWLALVGSDLGAATDDRLAFITAPLSTALGDVQAGIMWLLQNGMANPDHAGAGATAFMRMMGHVALGHMWLKMADASLAALDAGTADPDFHQAKLTTARFFAARVLPETSGLRAQLEAGADTVMALPAEMF